MFGNSMAPFYDSIQDVLDPLTHAAWCEEFEKQYPKPESIHPFIPGERELFEANRACYIANRAGVGSNDIAIELAFRFADCRQIEFINRGIKTNTPVKAWESWRHKCYQRFIVVFKSDPLEALKALKRGDLLIDME